MAIGLFLVMVIGITVIIGEVTKIEQAEQLVTDGYISMEKYYGRVEKKIETCQKYANILTALSADCWRYQWKYGNRGRSHCPVSY